MFIKRIVEVIAPIGNFLLFVATFISRPVLLAKLEMETEILDGEVECPICHASNINVAIVPHLGSKLPVWSLDSGGEELELTCKKCGAPI